MSYQMTDKRKDRREELKQKLVGVCFVYSDTQIAEDKITAKGRRISAIDAIDLLGPDCIREVLAEGSAILPHLR